MLLGLVEMVIEAFLEISVSGLLDHFGQCFHNLMLGAVHVLESMQEKVFHRLDVFAEEAHSMLPKFLRPRRGRRWSPVRGALKVIASASVAMPAA